MTVRSLLAEMDSRELTEWMAYDVVEPFGDGRGDIQAGVVASTIANIHRTKNARPYKPTDFVPRYGEPPPREPTADEAAAATMAMFGIVQ
jgi:hypothetical protein